MLVYNKTESKPDVLYAYIADSTAKLSNGAYIYITSKLTNQQYNLYLDDWDIEHYSKPDFIGIPKEYMSSIPIGEYEYKIVDYRERYIGNGMLLIGPYTKDTNTTKNHTEIKYTTLDI